MKVITLQQIERQYKNNGQHAEQTVRFNLTGKIEKADNRPYTLGGDCLDIQIKSARATVCKGTDLSAYLALDGAKSYGYVTADFQSMYIMDKAEYAEFAETFGTITRESKANGGSAKIRLKHESKELIEWLRARA